MPVHDFNAQRLFVEAELTAGAGLLCSPAQANYLRNVLRMRDGDNLRLFNGRDGEWLATLAARGKRELELIVSDQVRPQQDGPNIEYLFAPLKRARLDYMVQKATELGVARLRPVLTQHTVAERVNGERMRANVIEAAEQCGILRVPQVESPVPLDKLLAAWDSERRLVFCDEAAAIANPLTALAVVAPGAPVAVLIGPEGGFSAAEREGLRSKPFTLAISLGPRIMRADTAAVAALALVNAAVGDWR